MTLHITKKVQEKIKVSVDNPAYTTNENAFLDDWYVNLFTVNRKSYFIYTESKTLYSIVKQAKNINNTRAFYKQVQSVVEEICRKGNVKICIEERNVRYCNTSDKVILGSQVDLIKMAKYQVWDNEDFDFEKINETPLSYIATSPERELKNQIETHSNTKK